MPIYEFVCNPCDSRFEILTSISRASEVRCPKCGSDNVKRLVSLFAARSATSDGSVQSRGSGCSSCSSGNCSSCRH